MYKNNSALTFHLDRGIPLSQTYFHGSKGVWAIEVGLQLHYHTSFQSWTDIYSIAFSQDHYLGTLSMKKYFQPKPLLDSGVERCTRTWPNDIVNILVSYFL